MREHYRQVLARNVLSTVRQMLRLRRALGREYESADLLVVENRVLAAVESDPEAVLMSDVLTLWRDRYLAELFAAVRARRVVHPLLSAVPPSTALSASDIWNFEHRPEVFPAVLLRPNCDRWMSNIGTILHPSFDPSDADIMSAMESHYRLDPAAPSPSSMSWRH